VVWRKMARACVRGAAAVCTRVPAHGTQVRDVVKQEVRMMERAAFARDKSMNSVLFYAMPPRYMRL